MTGSVALAQDETTTEPDAPAEVKPRTKTVESAVQNRKPAGFLMEGLEADEIVSGYVTGLTGNLDPFLLLLPSDTLFADIGAAYEGEVQRALAEGNDPLAVIPQIADQYFLVWDDDSGAGYDATFQYTIPEDGDYRIVVISSPYGESVGDFELEVSVAPAGSVPGEGISIEDDLIAYVPETSTTIPVSQEVTGTLTLADSTSFAELNEIKAGDTIYVYAEALSGDLKPILRLEDFGGKPLSTGNVAATEPSVGLEYTFPADGENYQLWLTSLAGDDRTAGDFRLLIGINDPEVLTGRSDAPFRSILRQPTRVRFGMKLDQITGVDQKSENFGVVAEARMEWTDPRLAFSPDDCQCRFKTYTVSSFSQLVTSLGADWPEYTIFNQQGRRDSQSPTVVLQPDGSAIFVDRFSATLQAPDFNFRRFPFDVQDFYVRYRAIFPEEFYIYEPIPGYSGFGDQLGEEEWVTEENDVFIDTSESRSRFNFHFDAYRHLSFYIFRIFVPVLLIIVVSWITFFLADYTRRIEVTSGNLLVFIAFNFTISDDLPRLGYLTFMDMVLISTFVVTALVIVLNVYLKRLEVKGKGERAHRIDKFVIWFYPVAYLIGGLIVTILFFTEFGTNLAT